MADASTSVQKEPYRAMPRVEPGQRLNYGPEDIRAMQEPLREGCLVANNNGSPATERHGKFYYDV